MTGWRGIFSGVILGLGILCASCGSADDSTSAGSGDAETGPEIGGGPPGTGDQDGTSLAVCDGASWSEGTRAFEEATDDWGLTGITGSLFSVVDFDQDGWPDVFVRGGGGEKEYAPGLWLFRNTGEGTFEDVTQASGILATRGEFDPEWFRPAHIVVWGDVDNDGYPDAFIAFGTKDATSAQGESPEIVLNNGDGTFRLGPEAGMARRAGLLNSPAGAAFTDYDRDGSLDLWVSHHDFVDDNGGMNPVADHLYQGDGTGMTIDTSNATGVVTFPWGDLGKLNAAEGHSWAWSAAACDLNNDGTPELLAASYGRAPNLLWQGIRQGDGTVQYANRSVSSGYAWDHRQDWTDNWSARCYCMDEPEAEDCQLTEAIDPNVCAGLKASFGDNYRWYHDGDREPWRLAGNSGTTLCADFNNDGDMDLFTNEIVHADVGESSDPSEIMVNTGEADVRFERPGGESTGIWRDHEPGSYYDHGDMTSTMLDFDNDGWMDLYLGASDYPGNRGLLFHQSLELTFTEVPISDAFEHNRSDGAVAADFDRDGDLDLLVGHSHMRCDPNGLNDCYPTRQIRLFRNVLGDQGQWVQLKLRGADGTNAAAIGARVQVTAIREGRESEHVEISGTTQTQEVGGGYGKGGFQNGLVLHFGLGQACDADVTIRWPDAALTTQTFQVQSRTRYEVQQGETPTVMD